MWIILIRLILETRTLNRRDWMGSEKGVGPVVVQIRSSTCWKVTVYHTDGREGWLKGDAMPYLLLDWPRGVIYRANSGCQVRSKGLKYDGAPGETKLSGLEPVLWHNRMIWWWKARTYKRIKDIGVGSRQARSILGIQTINDWVVESQSQTKNAWAPGTVPRQTRRTLLHKN